VKKGKLYKIGDLARLVEKTPRAIRLYEERGLLTPRSRTCGGFRLYGPEALARIKWVDQLQTLGLSLNSIATLLNSLCDGRQGKLVVNDLQTLFEKSIQSIQKKIQELESLKQELSQTLLFYEDCKNCVATHLPDACHDCVNTDRDDLPELVLGLLATRPKETKPDQQPNSNPV
jgi:DNA-binding transcriptional MerR regulator